MRETHGAHGGHSAAERDGYTPITRHTKRAPLLGREGLAVGRVFLRKLVAMHRWANALREQSLGALCPTGAGRMFGKSRLMVEDQARERRQRVWG